MRAQSRKELGTWGMWRSHTSERERGAAAAGLAMVLKDFVYNKQSSFRYLLWLYETITSP